MDLSGEWKFELDPHDQGVDQAWFSRMLTDAIQLPGCLQAQGYGDEITVDTPWTGGIVDQSWFEDDRYAPYRKPGQVKVPFWLQPPRYYKGAAWYQREITIPTGWENSRWVLNLERPHWETRLWFDDQEIGADLSLSTPHLYDLGHAVHPGKHTLTLRVDNRMIINVGPNAHSMTDHTQGNWNGVVGEIKLEPQSPIWISSVQIYPDIKNKIARLEITIQNGPGIQGSAILSIEGASVNTPQPARVPKHQIEFALESQTTLINDKLDLGEKIKLWDEFTPNLYQLHLTLDVRADEQNYRDMYPIRFGMREVQTEGTQISVNGRKTFLRGTLESCIFPLTGYPPTDIDAWKHIIQVCKDHGLNHLRFHSWCPPEAAFQAADEMGFYYQVECASWANQGASLGEGNPLDEWLYEEANRIIEAYGNHPSFLLMAYGNEPGGNFVEYLESWVEHWKEKDPRRLHTSAAGWPSIPQNQFQNTPLPRIHAWGAGLSSRINSQPPETITDYREYVEHFKAPIISHEIGQWCAYPNFSEIEKYTGFMKPKNFEIFRDSLQANHMGDQADDFLMASGKLQALCYKEEIESSLRTPGFGGFQLLDLHDFPGQGTALVGVLDPFWEEKGYISADQFRRFCNTTVPLARMEKRIWSRLENFKAEIEIFHFGPEQLRAQVVTWELLNAAGIPVANGVFPAQDIPSGSLHALSQIDFPLHHLNPAEKYTLTIRLEGTQFQNDWDLWVFDPESGPLDSNQITVTNKLDELTISQLENGGKVLYLPTADQVKVSSVIGFSSVFWNTAWTGNQAPHTLGILCDPDHPIFRNFPTEYHSNWQWWELIHNSAALQLDSLTPKLRSLVQPIDTWFENRRLGLLLEARVGAGQLMICSMDLETGLDQRLVARQMRQSIINYMESADYQPGVSLTLEEVTDLFVPTNS